MTCSKYRSASISRLPNAVESMTARLDFPVPRIPIKTMDALWSNSLEVRRVDPRGVGDGWREADSDKGL